MLTQVKAFGRVYLVTTDARRLPQYALVEVQCFSKRGYSYWRRLAYGSPMARAIAVIARSIQPCREI